MDDSFIARMGYDPVRIYTHIHGQPPAPGGVVRVNPRGVAPDPPPAEPDPPPREESDPPREDGEGGETPPAATDAEAAPPPPREAAPEPEPDTASDPEPAQPETNRPSETLRAIRAWLDAHWDAVEAMALAGEAPQRPAPPPPPLKPTPAPPLPPVHVRPGDRWNKPKMVDFLRQLAATHSVSAAARSVGMTRSSAYRLRNRLKGQPFDIAWEAAFRHGYDNLAHAALDRALNGVEVPHYHAGELVGTSRKFDERLTVALLASRNRAGAPMLGRYGAAAEYWGEHWDTLLERVGTGAVDWSDELEALGEEERKRLGVPDAERELVLLNARNMPDERGGGFRR